MTAPVPVPKALAKEMRRARWPRRLRFTREGKWFVGVTLAVGFAAINTGNNLLYLSLGMLLSFIVLSGVLSESTLRAVTVRRLLPRELFADELALVEVVVTNPRRRVSSFALEIRERALLAAAPRGTLPMLAATGAGFVLKLGPGETARLATRVRFAVRGRHVLGAVSVTTRFPFGLFEKTRDVPATEEVVVYPQRVAARRPALPRGAGEGEHRASRPGGGDAVGELRDWRHGDDARQIHWRTSARLDRTIVRERQGHTSQQVWLTLADRAEDPAVHAAAFEDEIRRTAGLADSYLAEGWAVGLRTHEIELAPAPGHIQRTRILRALALAELHTGASASTRDLASPVRAGARA